jgi:hypothetical protein
MMKLSKEGEPLGYLMQQKVDHFSIQLYPETLVKGVYYGQYFMPEAG